jgi:DNA-binding NarL/FixJ family response regulator
MYAERCLRAGAKGYVMKQELPQGPLEGVRRVLKGEVNLSEAMTKQLRCRISSFPERKQNSPSELLSDREIEMFEVLGRRRRTREIVQLLHLSEKSIQTHREHIEEKLNVNDAVSLVRQAVHWVEAQK